MCLLNVEKKKEKKKNPLRTRINYKLNKSGED